MSPTIKTVLLKLQWITLNNEGNLIATEHAPNEFKTALAEFHQDLEDINTLKNLYTKYAENTKHVDLIFGPDEPDIKTIVEKLHQRKDKKNDSAAERTLETFHTQKPEVELTAVPNFPSTS